MPATAGLKFPAAVAAYTSVRFDADACPAAVGVRTEAAAAGAARDARITSATVWPFQPPTSQVAPPTEATAESATGAGSTASARTRPVLTSTADTRPTAMPATLRPPATTPSP